MSAVSVSDKATSRRRFITREQALDMEQQSPLASPGLTAVSSSVTLPLQADVTHDLQSSPVAQSSADPLPMAAATSAAQVMRVRTDRSPESTQFSLPEKHNSSSTSSQLLTDHAAARALHSRTHVDTVDPWTRRSSAEWVKQNSTVDSSANASSTVSLADSSSSVRSKSSDLSHSKLIIDASKHSPVSVVSQSKNVGSQSHISRDTTPASSAPSSHFLRSSSAESTFGSKLSMGLKDNKFIKQQQVQSHTSPISLESKIRQAANEASSISQDIPDFVDPAAAAFSPTVPLQSSTGVLPPHDVYRPRSLYDTHSHLPSTVGSKLTTSQSASDMSQQLKHVPPRHADSLPDTLVSKVCKPHFGQVFHPRASGHGINSPRSSQCSSGSEADVSKKLPWVKDPLRAGDSSKSMTTLTQHQSDHDKHANTLKQLLEPFCAKEREAASSVSGSMESINDAPRRYLGRNETVDVSMLTRRRDIEIEPPENLTRNRPQSMRASNRRIFPAEPGSNQQSKTEDQVSSSIAHLVPALKSGKGNKTHVEGKKESSKGEINKLEHRFSNTSQTVREPAKAAVIPLVKQEKAILIPKVFQKASSLDETDACINMVKWKESKEEKPIRVFAAQVPPAVASTGGSVVLSTEPLYPSDLGEKKNISRTSLVFSKKAISSENVLPRRGSDDSVITTGRRQGNTIVKQISLESTDGRSDKISTYGSTATIAKVTAELPLTTSAGIQLLDNKVASHSLPATVATVPISVSSKVVTATSQPNTFKVSARHTVISQPTISSSSYDAFNIPAVTTVEGKFVESAPLQSASVTSTTSVLSTSTPVVMSSTLKQQQSSSSNLAQPQLSTPFVVTSSVKAPKSTQEVSSNISNSSKTNPVSLLARLEDSPKISSSSVTKADIITKPESKAVPIVKSALSSNQDTNVAMKSDNITTSAVVDPVMAKNTDISGAILQPTSSANPPKVMREDSFNRPDSPDYEPMPLPKDSVIMRYRLKKRDKSSSSSSSSSSDTDEQCSRSPHLSPRVPHKKLFDAAKRISGGRSLDIPGVKSSGHIGGGSLKAETTLFQSSGRARNGHEPASAGGRGASERARMKRASTLPSAPTTLSTTSSSSSPTLPGNQAKTLVTGNVPPDIRTERGFHSDSAGYEADDIAAGAALESTSSTDNSDSVRSRRAPWRSAEGGRQVSSSTASSMSGPGGAPSRLPQDAAVAPLVQQQVPQQLVGAVNVSSSRGIPVGGEDQAHKSATGSQVNTSRTSPLQRQQAVTTSNVANVSAMSLVSNRPSAVAPSVTTPTAKSLMHASSTSRTPVAVAATIASPRPGSAQPLTSTAVSGAVTTDAGSQDGFDNRSFPAGKQQRSRPTSGGISSSPVAPPTTVTNKPVVPLTTTSSLASHSACPNSFLPKSATLPNSAAKVPTSVVPHSVTATAVTTTSTSAHGAASTEVHSRRPLSEIVPSTVNLVTGDKPSPSHAGQIHMQANVATAGRSGGNVHVTAAVSSAVTHPALSAPNSYASAGRPASTVIANQSSTPSTQPIVSAAVPTQQFHRAQNVISTSITSATATVSPGNGSTTQLSPTASHVTSPPRSPRASLTEAQPRPLEFGTVYSTQTRANPVGGVSSTLTSSPVSSRVSQSALPQAPVSESSNLQDSSAGRLKSPPTSRRQPAGTSIVTGTSVKPTSANSTAGVPQPIVNVAAPPVPLLSKGQATITSSVYSQSLAAAASPPVSPHQQSSSSSRYQPVSTQSPMVPAVTPVSPTLPTDSREPLSPVRLVSPQAHGSSAGYVQRSQMNAPVPSAQHSTSTQMSVSSIQQQHPQQKQSQLLTAKALSSTHASMLSTGQSPENVTSTSIVPSNPYSSPVQPVSVHSNANTSPISPNHSQQAVLHVSQSSVASPIKSTAEVAVSANRSVLVSTQPLNMVPSLPGRQYLPTAAKPESSVSPPTSGVSRMPAVVAQPANNAASQHNVAELSPRSQAVVTVTPAVTRSLPASQLSPGSMTKTPLTNSGPQSPPATAVIEANAGAHQPQLLIGANTVALPKTMISHVPAMPISGTQRQQSNSETVGSPISPQATVRQGQMPVSPRARPGPPSVGQAKLASILDSMQPMSGDNSLATAPYGTPLSIMTNSLASSPSVMSPSTGAGQGPLLTSPSQSIDASNNDDRRSSVSSMSSQHGDHGSMVEIMKNRLVREKAPDAAAAIAPVEHRNFNIKTGARDVHTLTKQFATDEGSKSMKHEGSLDSMGKPKDFSAQQQVERQNDKNVGVAMRNRSNRGVSMHELPSILNRRSLHETSWRTEADGASSEENEKLISEFEFWLETQKQRAQQTSQAPLDNQLMKVLGQRRKTTDFSVVEAPSSDTEVISATGSSSPLKPPVASLQATSPVVPTSPISNIVPATTSLSHVRPSMVTSISTNPPMSLSAVHSSPVAGPPSLTGTVVYQSPPVASGMPVMKQQVQSPPAVVQQSHTVPSPQTTVYSSSVTRQALPSTPAASISALVTQAVAPPVSSSATSRMAMVPLTTSNASIAMVPQTIVTAAIQPSAVGKPTVTSASVMPQMIIASASIPSSGARTSAVAMSHQTAVNSVPSPAINIVTASSISVAGLPQIAQTSVPAPTAGANTLASFSPNSGSPNVTVVQAQGTVTKAADNGKVTTVNARPKRPMLQRAKTLDVRELTKVVDEQLLSIMKSRKVALESDPNAISTNETASSDVPSERVRHDEEVKDSEEQIIPISERIYRMQSRLEELQHAAKSAPISWGGSGIATPKAKFKSSSGSPGELVGGGNERQEESLAGQEQLLMDRLTEVQDKQVSAAARRRNFHTTSRFDKRRLTLPVTLQEINDANNLEMQQSMHESRAIDNPEELPQAEDVKRVRSLWESASTKKRSNEPSHPFLVVKHSTVDLAELSPTTMRQTSAELVTRNASKSPVTEDDFDKMVDFNMSVIGYTPPILSSKEALPLSLERDQVKDGGSGGAEGAAEDESSRMNMSQKLALFNTLTAKAKHSEGPVPLSALQQRRQLERSKTQPISIEDVRKASDLSAAAAAKTTMGAVKTQSRSLASSSSMDRPGMSDVKLWDDDAEEKQKDDLCSLSLDDKRRMFSRSKQDVATVTQQQTDSDKRKFVRDPSRFKTQPITLEEVVTASYLPQRDSIVHTAADRGYRPRAVSQELAGGWAGMATGADEDLLDAGSGGDDDQDRGKWTKNEAIARRKRMLERKTGDSNTTTTSSTHNTDSPTTRSQSDSAAVDVGGSGVSVQAAIKQRLRLDVSAMSSQQGGSPASLSPTSAKSATSAAAGSASAPSTPLAGGSLANRLAALQKSADEDWQARLVKRQGGSATVVDKEVVKLRERPEGSKGERPLSVVERIAGIKESSEGWRGRVDTENDAKQFSVEGRIQTAGNSKLQSPSLLADKQVKAPRVPLVRESGAIAASTPNGKRPLTLTQSSPGSVSAPPIPIIITQPRSPSLSAPSLPDDAYDDLSPADDTVSTVHAPTFDIDDTFASFYDQSLSLSASQPDISFKVDDLDIVETTSNLIRPQQKVRPQRRKVNSSINPLRTLAARKDVKSMGYEETRTGIAERELSRIKYEQMVGSGKLGDEAVQALSTKEDMSKVVLRHHDNKASPVPGISLHWLPYTDLMLIQVKGRRPGQVRLVEPSAKSINSGDCFILITPNDIFLWIGEFCNVIEKVKATEIANYVYHHKDLGSKHTLQVTTVHEAKQDLSGGQKFWKTLGGRADYQSAGPADEDEIYENLIVGTNMVYRLGDEKLHPVQDYWGKTLKHDMLKSNEVMVFDFGSELYVWNGKDVTPDQRRLALRLSQELWEHGYDYTGCGINPLSPLLAEDQGGLAPKASSRPPWALKGKINEKGETVLFREKFSDWPDPSRLLRAKKSPSSSSSSHVMTDMLDIKVADVQVMMIPDEAPVSLELEGSQVGRGQVWVDTSDGLRREYEILTLNVDVWHILEYSRFQLDSTSKGQFHEGDTYVVRWHYQINQKVKALKGKADRSSVTGRERYAYFFWQGSKSIATEQGTSALMAVEMDEEKGPQVRLNQTAEPPCFIGLFGGHMVVHLGRREGEGSSTGDEAGDSHLYMVRNELQGEAYLVEVQPRVANLRSRTSFFLLSRRTGNVLLWHGCAVSSAVRERATEIAQWLQQSCPSEMRVHAGAKVTVTEVEEGHEPKEFWSQLDSHDRVLYHSLLEVSPKPDYTPRLFYMNSLSGTFAANEVLNPCRSADVTCAYAFLQSDMYSVSQPALFLLDNHHEVYVWQGWWPSGSTSADANANVVTGSAHSRFTVDRLSTLRTALDYCAEKGLSLTKCSLVFAGVEPLTFTNLFPFWTLCEEAAKANLAEGRKEGEVVSVQDLYERLTETKYTWQQLQERPLPEGVNPLKLEFYLEDSEFELMLGMKREEFAALPSWKQNNVKREVGLF